MAKGERIVKVLQGACTEQIHISSDSLTIGSQGHLCIPANTKVNN